MVPAASDGAEGSRKDACSDHRLTPSKAEIMRTQPRTTTILVALVATAAFAGLALAPSATALPSPGGGTYYASASASESNGRGCVVVNGITQCYSTILRTNAAFYMTAGAVVRTQGCQTHVCPPVQGWYYGYATPDGRTYIVIGPGPTPPPSCGYSCPPMDYVQWVLDQLP